MIKFNIYQIIAIYMFDIILIQFHKNDWTTIQQQLNNKIKA